MNVSDVMSDEVVTVQPDMLLKDLAQLLSAKRISGVPVTDTARTVIGVVSEGDLVEKQVGRSVRERTPLDWIFGERPSRQEIRKRAATTVREAMTTPAITISADAPLWRAASLMVGRGVNRLPVLDQGRLVGIITRADLVRAYLTRDEEIGRVVREDVIRNRMWLDPDDLRVDVREGIVRLAGTVDRRSTATILEKLVGVVDGVNGVVNELEWKFDDSRIEPVEAEEPVPGAASLTARERQRPMHR